MVTVVSTEPQPSAPHRVGVVGGGQLALMMGEEARAQGVWLCVLAGSHDDPAVSACDEAIIGDPKDPAALAALAERVEVITFDHELVDLDLLGQLEARGLVLRPGSRALRYAVDKAYQRQRFFEAGLAVPRFVCVRDATDPRLDGFLDSLAGPPVIKLARGGYDGRGVLFPRNRAEAIALIDEAGDEVVVEERLELRAELAQLLVRGVNGATELYPLVSTVQSEGMCVEVRYPATDTQRWGDDAAKLAARIATLTGAVGIVAIELFVTDDGLYVNEIALRPHNTGHWSIEGARTSQFANHLRAVSSQPLGPTTPSAACAAMVNIVGAEVPGSPEVARSIEGAHVHDYRKAWRPGRKLGHVTVVGTDAHAVHVKAWRSARAYGTSTKEA